MDRNFITELKLKAAQSVLFGRLVNEKHVGLFQAIELSSGEFLSKANMHDGKYKVFGGGGATKSIHDKWNIDFLTIGIGRVGARCGCIFKIPPQSWVTDNALYVSKIKGEYDLDFLLYFLSYCNFNQYANTAAQPVISQKRISGVQIPQIDIELQKKFVEVLSAIESGEELTVDEFGVRKIINRIEKNVDLLNELTHQQSLLARLRQSILQEAVQGQLTAQWRQANPHQEPASELLRRIQAEKAATGKKEKPLPPVKAEEMPFELPEGWVWCRLGDLTDNITKGSSPKWQGIRYVENPTDGILFITSKNVGNYTLLLDDLSYVEARFNEIEPRSILKKGDLLTNIVGGSIGRTAIYHLDKIANINQAVCLIRIETEKVNKAYLLHLMNSGYLINLMFESQFAPGRANLSMSNIANFPIPLPPLPEQTAIVAQVERLLGLVGQLEAEAAGQRVQAEGLLQAALREAMGA